MAKKKSYKFRTGNRTRTRKETMNEYKPVFRVNEFSGGFNVEHIPTGQTHWMSDGVDVLFDENDHAYSPGEDTFRLRWELSYNETPSDIYEAYFPDLNPDDYDAPQIPEGDTETLLRVLTNITPLVTAINEQCDEKFRVELGGDDGDWVTLFNGETEITQGYDSDVEKRVKQIAHENGVSL